MNDELFDVKGTLVLVSGGSRGIGLSLAEGFAQRGAKVVITGRSEESLKESCAASDYALEYEVCDVADEKAIATCVDNVVSRFKKIDTLINCAGINIRMPVEEFTGDEFDQVMNINLRGAFLMATAVGRQMIAQGSGSQINIDSLSTYGSLSRIVPYGMSKSGLGSMTRGMAMEWGKHGVRVNGLAPGFIMTALTEKIWSSPKMQNWHKVVAPLERLGAVEDLIGTAIFLASPAAAFMTGQVLRVDGGISAGIAWPVAGDFEVSITD